MKLTTYRDPKDGSYYLFNMNGFPVARYNPDIDKLPWWMDELFFDPSSDIKSYNADADDRLLPLVPKVSAVCISANENEVCWYFDKSVEPLVFIAVRSGGGYHDIWTAFHAGVLNIFISKNLSKEMDDIVECFNTLIECIYLDDENEL